MRSSLIIVLSALVGLSPAVQANSCACRSVAERDAGSPDSCCCGGGDSCCCPGCDQHDSREPSPALDGCACTRTPPQWNPEPGEAAAAPLADGYELLSTDQPNRPAAAFVPAKGNAARPPTFRPLLL